MLNWLDNLEGASHPWKVEDLDDLDEFGNPRMFVLKHFRQGDLRPRVIDYVAGQFAAVLLPYAPRVKILQLSAELLDEYSSVRADPRSRAIPNLLGSAVAGPQMAVEWIDGDSLGGDHPILGRLADPTQIPEIIGCDGMLQNMDRDGWNMLVRSVPRTTPRKYELIPYDWDYAFFAHEPGTGQLESIRNVWKLLRMEGLRARINGKEDFAGFKAPAIAGALLVSDINTSPRGWSATGSGTPASKPAAT